MKNNKKNIGTRNSKFIGPFFTGGDVATVVIVVIGLIVCHQKRWWSHVRVVLVMKQWNEKKKNLQVAQDTLFDVSWAFFGVF